MGEHTDKGLIISAIIGGIFLIVATVLAGVFNLASKSFETSRVTNSNFNLAPTSNTNSPPAKEVAKQTVQPIFIGSVHEVTLVPVDVGAIGWDGQSCLSEVIFVSPTDKRTWAKLVFAGREHFVGFYAGLSDYLNGLDNEVRSASQIKEGDSFTLKTDAFNAVITVANAQIGDDPDPTKPYPSVFKRLTLKVQVHETKKKK